MVLEAFSLTQMEKQDQRIMSVQLTKRALATGLGAGACALLAETQRASADTSFTSYSFPASGAPTARTMPDRLADIVNVRDYGAVGNGVIDDTAALQAAIDAAFGPASSPHGIAATSNRPLFFPNGTYLVSSPLTLTRVRGAHIYGSGQLTTTIQAANGAIMINGMEYCSFENLSFSAGSGSASSGAVAFEMNWDGTGAVGLQGNIFTNCSFGGGDYACRIGFSGHGGANNQFYACNFSNAAIAGMVTWSPGAMGQSIQGGGASINGSAFWVKSGQIASINDVGLAGNTNQDVLMDSIGPMLIKGCRTESPLFCPFNNPLAAVVLDGNSSSMSVKAFCHTQGKAILDSCSTDTSSSTVLCSDSSFTGTVYIRGCYFAQLNFLTGFAGTVAQRI